MLSLKYSIIELSIIYKIKHIQLVLIKTYIIIELFCLVKDQDNLAQCYISIYAIPLKYQPKIYKKQDLVKYHKCKEPQHRQRVSASQKSLIFLKIPIILLTTLQTIIIAFNDYGQDQNTFYKAYRIQDNQEHFIPNFSFN